jgi:DNA processing protein
VNPTQADLALWTDWLTLAAIPQVGRRRLWQLVATLGSPEAVLRAKPAALREVEGVDEVTAQSIVDHRDALDLRPEAHTLTEMGARLISFLDDDYPRPLRTVTDPPPVLFVLGDLRLLDEIAVAVVGSRNMTDYGRQMAEAIAGDLAEAGITVISGFATGVDGVAHAAALDRGGRTLAVLGCGLDIVYPATHRRLRERIAAHGALITTYLPGTSPRAEHFPDRNAVLAGLSQAVVVVEAGEKSGALITAHHAVEQGRPVYAVPGDVTRANSAGVNRLIQEGARLVTSARDILTDLQGVLRGLLAELGGAATLGGEGICPDVPAMSPDVLASLSPEELELFRAIQAGPVQFDVLLRTVALAPERRQNLPMHLMNLQMHGLIDELPGKRFAARPSAATLSIARPGLDPQTSGNADS